MRGVYGITILIRDARQYEGGANMDEIEICALLRYGEDIHLECKKAEPTLPGSIWESYSSFANTEGGIILIGVEEHLREPDPDKRFTFVSVRNPEQRIKDVWNTVNSDKVSANILVDADVGTCSVHGATILWIHVPQADYRLRPVYINGNPLKGSFKRNHEGDYHCTEEEVKSMLRDASDTGNDGGLLVGYTMADIDRNALRSYRIEFEHRNPAHIWNGADDLTFLKNMGAYATDRSTGKEWLTCAGLLMFGQGIAVRERFDNIRLDYIDESNLDNLVFLDNGTQFVITSEKSGYMHLYLYDLNGRERQAITKGNFDIIDFYGYDPVRKLFYYSSYEESPLEKYIYSINEKGLKKKLTPVKGWNEASFSKNFNYYINVVSNTDTPPVTALYNAKGKQVRVLEDNKAVKEAVKAYNLAKPEFIQIPAADGKTMLNAWIMKPVNQKTGKKYPLLITQYSGPNSQQVKNNWSLSWLNYLAQEGYIVACIDPRGTAARGEEFRKCTYMQLGKLESDDMIAAAKWLVTQPDVDVKNIGIWGWSYGGFMSSLCIMKGNDIFTTAIAVAPVTHYKYYDSIYTERYMRTPAENERGYEDNAPLNWADKLKGNLLICHGTADDNVHVQNTYELAERLVQANKQFDMAIYTNRNHSIFGGNTTLQLYNRFVKYLNEHMKR